ncbi:hypothetical protein BDY24DRAFT_382565 [Mrakia frigida]|uniref:TFIIH/NER complex subunit TFB1 n=1 Tax=Mrakia frigida TaxID=29902 RepID=UPI003FCC1D17
MASKSAKASYKKEDGTLSLSKTHLLWTPATRASGVIEESLDKVAALFSSPPSSGKHNLKVTFTPPSSLPAGGVTFLFTHPSTAPKDAEEFKAQLAAIAATNKARLAGPSTPATPAAATPSTGGAPSPAAVGSLTAAEKGKGRATPLGAAGGGGLPGRDGRDVLTDWDLHKRVLVKNPQLAKLHYDLVQAGELTDAEFWEGRELLLLSESASSTQSAGRSSQLIDDRWSVKDSKGKGKEGAASSGGGSATSGTISLTPQLIRDIFDEFPEVQEAYVENVPVVCDQTSFWSRYFNSRLWERHRASARSSKLGSAKADEMFDRYLEAPDDGIAPRHNPASVANRFLDLAATEEDHNDSGNSEDITMQAGRERASLPLMRRFNEHSEKLLRATTQNPSSADEPAAKRLRTDGPSSRDEDRLAELDLDDLHSAQASKELPLDMNVQDRQRYFEGRSAAEEVAKVAERDEEETNAILEESRESFRGWKPQLEELRLDKRTAEDAMLGLTSSVKARVDAKTTRDDIPPDILKQMISCHTATCEFLRQFWSAILPTPPGNVLNVSSPAEKSAKAAKMVGYLAGTGEKVEAVVGAARGRGADGEKVRIALKPTLESVDKALFFYRSRKK